MLVEERVFYIDRDNQSTDRPTPVQVETNESTRLETRADLGWDVILNKPEAIRATKDFLDHRQKITEEAEREIAIRKARNEIHSNYLTPVTRVEQLFDMTSELNMGRNLEIVRFNFNEPNYGRIMTHREKNHQANTQGVNKVINQPRDNRQFSIPETKVA